MSITPTEIQSKLNDYRLREAIDIWHRFKGGIQFDCKIGVIYHADIDGVVGAAYVISSLRKEYPKISIHVYWLATHEYDFAAMLAWIAGNDLQHCIFLDIAIENSPETMERHWV